MKDLIIKELFEIGCIKFGNFKLKNKSYSPIYIDFRTLISFPKLLDNIVDAIWNLIKEKDLNLIFGVAYGGIPITSIISNKYKIPMIFNRKEKKNYGCKKMIEGIHDQNSKCILIDDVYTTGSSLQEAKQILKNNNIKCIDSVVICNRSNNKNINALFTLNEILYTLVKYHKIDDVIYRKCLDFISNKNDRHNKLININNKQSENKVHQKLKSVIIAKKSNLVFSPDVTDKNTLINLVNKVGKYICVLKIHSDIIENFDDEFITKLLKLSSHYNFLLFEDRKYCDIGNTFEKQYFNKLFKVNKWADLITIHCIAGPGILDCLRKHNSERGVLLVAQMSTKDNLINDEYTKNVINLSEKYSDLVVGLIGQSFTNSNLFNFTPGININSDADTLDQRYNNPLDAVENNTELFIIGRGIYLSDNPEKECQKYRTICWDTYNIKFNNA